MTRHELELSKSEARKILQRSQEHANTEKYR